MIRRTILFAVFATLAVVGSNDAEAKRKKRGKGPPPTGWQPQDEGQPHCYHSPQWDALNETDRRMKRAEVLDELLNQWRGQRSDGVLFDETVVEEVETVLLGRPTRIEEIVVQNLEKCTAGDAVAWEAWAKGLPRVLTAGECNTPLDYTMFDYLDIGVGWQRPLPMCSGDRVRISGTASDKYRIADGGPWINVGGDTAQPTIGTDAPCNLEGCFSGMLIAQFTGKSGVVTVFPVGSETNFTAPEDGEIAYRINDTQFFDNVWHKSGGLIDHTSIEISPAR